MQDVKHKLLLPTVMPTQFLSYPTSMLQSRSKVRKAATSRPTWSLHTTEDLRGASISGRSEKSKIPSSRRPRCWWHCQWIPDTRKNSFGLVCGWSWSPGKWIFENSRIFLLDPAPLPSQKWLFSCWNVHHFPARSDFFPAGFCTAFQPEITFFFFFFWISATSCSSTHYRIGFLMYTILTQILRGGLVTTIGHL